MLTKIYIVGDPAYYHRFGFKPSVSFGIKNANNIPNEYVLGCELVEGVLKRINGSIDFSNL
jgi:putative acetyltransferase